MLFLQASTEGNAVLDTTVDQLTESSIKLAEAAANFGALKVIFGVFLAFMLILILFYFYQMFAYNKKLSDIHLSTTRVQKYFEEASNRSLGGPQASVLVRRSFGGLAQNIKYVILRTRIENGRISADNKDAISGKIARLVNYEYAELASFFSNYMCNEKALSEMINTDDAQIIIAFMLEQITESKETFSISNMDQATDILINGLKRNAVDQLIAS